MPTRQKGQKFLKKDLFDKSGLYISLIKVPFNENFVEISIKAFSKESFWG
jgi:hypothetical protein